MIRLRTLGALDLRGSEGQELRTVLAQPKRAALLAYLAISAPRGPHQRDTLLALFWPEQDTEHARNALSQAVHFLRRSLGSEALIAGNGEGLGLDWKDFWCDAVAFEDALEAGRPADALDLYRGELLEGFHIADAPEFEQWLETERGRLAVRYEKAVEGMAEQRQAARDWDGAIREWRRLAGRDPYNSRVALRLMRALAAAGDPAGAAQHARVHEALLREELDVAPDPEIGALVRELQAPRAQGVVRLRGSPPVPIQAATPATTEASGVKAIDGKVDGPTARQNPRRRIGVMAAGIVALFAVGAGAVALRNGAREPPPPLIRSLAVLPLENLSGDSAQQSFTDGMHDLLITELARYPELSVISRTSVLQYRGTKKRLPEIARELKVDGVIEGAVLQEGGRIRLTAQLVHGPSDRHLWAQHYERDVRDVLLLQGELAEAIAREVNVAAKPLERARRIATGPADSAPQELYLRELYLRGRHAELSRSFLGVQTAKEAYRRAIDRDSTFALGYAGLAAAYGFLADYTYAPVGPALDSARMMAERAVSLDSTLPETRTALAVTLGDHGEFGAAEREFRRAIELGPSNARAHYWYSILLVALGRGEEALREAIRAAELDPFAPRGLLAMQRYAVFLMTGQRPHLKQLPVRERRPILKLEPGEPWARARDAVELSEEGKCAEARSEIGRARQLVPGNNMRMLPDVGSVYWWCGERPRARVLLAEMKRRPDARDQGFRIARLHALFGEKDSAFAWLEHPRWTMAQLSGLSADRFMDPLRSDSRFVQLQRRLGVRSP
jgi:DNA-binding SARP family transcriptional activator/TolB-like protein/Flp pilus assembly protein TadD